MKNRLIYSTNTELYHWSSASLRIRSLTYKIKVQKKKTYKNFYSQNDCDQYIWLCYICTQERPYMPSSFVLSSAECLSFYYFFLYRHSYCSFSLSLINAQINICVCVLFVSLHSESESAVLYDTLDSHLVDNKERKEREKRECIYRAYQYLLFA